MKRLFYAVSVATIFGTLPLLAFKVSTESVFGRMLWFVGALVALPGTFVGVIAARGRWDDIDFRIADVCNFIFYFALAYFLLAFWERRNAESHRLEP
jgi:hypothetical protein